MNADWHDPDEDFGEQAASGVSARVWATTDDQGRFKLHRVHPQVDLSVTPYRSSIRLAKTKQIPSDARQPIRLQTESLQLVSLSGRVVDEDGKPIVDAECWLLARFDDDDTRSSGTFVRKQSSDRDGRFKTATDLPRRYSYRLSVRTREGEAATSDWLCPQQAGTTVFRDVSASRKKLHPEKPVQPPSLSTGELSRTVVDRSGKPVPGARVVAWYTAARRRRSADAKGRFVFRDVPTSGAWVFVRADGFRFHGEFARPDDESKQIVLTGVKEPGSPAMKTIPAGKVAADVMVLARTRLREFVETVLNTDNAHRKSEVHRTLAAIDPEAALKLIGDNRLDFSTVRFTSHDGITYDDWHAFIVRYTAAQAKAKTDVAEALRIAETIDRPGYRVRSLIRVAETLPPSAGRRKREVLERAATLMDKVESATGRVEHRTYLASRFRSIGENKRARELFATAQREAAKLGDSERSGFSRGFLAWELAPFDHRAALELIRNETAARELARYRGNIAHQIAAVDPAEAERVLGLLESGRSRDGMAVRVCYRMAGADYPRARRIAQSITNPRRRAYAWGLMADAVRERDGATARQLLDKAYQILESQVNSGDRSGRDIQSPLTIAVGLLPTAERAAPDRLREFLWRVLSLRTNVTQGSQSRALGRHGPGGRMRLADPVLGAFLARYDRETARLLTTTPGDETIDLGYFDAPYFLPGALAILDPPSAVSAAARLPDKTDREQRGKHEAWRQVLAMLGKSTEQRWVWLMDRQYHLWRPDRVDH